MEPEKLHQNFEKNETNSQEEGSIYFSEIEGRKKRKLEIYTSTTVKAEYDSLTQFEKDLLLLSHLIPCCQYYKTDETFKLNFESELDQWKISFAFGSEESFWNYLLSNRANQSIKKQIENNGKYTKSWELMICLMRNIFCHEHYFNFRSVQELLVEALKFFQSRERIWNMLLHYWNCISFPSFIHGTSDFSGVLCSFDAWISQRLDPKVQRDILTFIELIPIRCNNSIVDESFEDEMKSLSETMHFENWELYATFLKTHPANKQQIRINVEDISWIMTIRLMRNILGHESSFHWTNLKEFSFYSLQFFGSMDMISTIFNLYKNKCFASLPNSPKLVVKEPARIQLKDISNCFVIEKNFRYLIFIGFEALYTLVHYLQSSSPEKCKQFNFIFGNKYSGKTLTCKYIIPYLLQKEKILEYIYLDCSLIREFDSIHAIFKSLNLQLSLKQEGNDNFEEKFLQTLFHYSILKPFVLILDNVDLIFSYSPFNIQQQFVEIVQKRIKENGDCTCHVLISADSLFLWRMETLSSLTDRNSFLVDLPVLSSESDLKAFQLLARHYCKIDKYEMKKILTETSSQLSCAHFASITFLLSSNTLVNEAIKFFWKNLVVHCFRQIQQLPSKTANEILTGALKGWNKLPKGKHWKLLLVKKEKIYFFKDSFYHACLLLHSIQSDGKLYPFFHLQSLNTENGINLWRDLFSICFFRLIPPCNLNSSLHAVCETKILAQLTNQDKEKLASFHERLKSFSEEISCPHSLLSFQPFWFSCFQEVTQLLEHILNLSDIKEKENLLSQLCTIVISVVGKRETVKQILESICPFFHN